jgi:hypothetical protein
MSEPYMPGPYDEYRGVVEIDCSECLPPELKAQFRIGKFVPVTASVGETQTDLDSNPASPADPGETPPPVA